MAERYNYDLQRERLVWLADVIAEYVADKDRQYGSSWRKRGGAGAFMVMARKWDRIETACEWEDGDYNIFRVFDSDDRQENIGDDVIDLIGYLLVLLEYMIALELVGSVCGEPVPNSKRITPKSGRTEQSNPFGYDEEEDDEEGKGQGKG